MNDFIESNSPTNSDPLFMAEFVGIDTIVIEKLGDAMTPAIEVEFTPEEAENVGAFTEDAMSEEDAADSVGDAAEVGEAAPAVP